MTPETLYVYQCSEGHRVHSRLEQSIICARCQTDEVAIMPLIATVTRRPDENPREFEYRALTTGAPA